MVQKTTDISPDLHQYVKVRDQAEEMAARQGVTHFVNHTPFGYQVSTVQDGTTRLAISPNGGFTYPNE